MTHYIHDEKNNRIEGMSKEEIYALIDEVIQTGELPTDTPAAFVTALKSIVDGNAYKIGFCTQAEYNQLEAQGQLVANALYIITDDETEEDIEAALEDLDARVTDVEAKHLYRHDIIFTNTFTIDTLTGTYNVLLTLYTNSANEITFNNFFNHFTFTSSVVHSVNAGGAFYATSSGASNAIYAVTEIDVGNFDGQNGILIKSTGYFGSSPVVVIVTSQPLVWGDKVTQVD